jgi:hypothetical protein
MHQVSMPLARTTDAPNIQAEAATGAAALRPALFARYGALARLRYDFPLVLVEGDGDGPVLRPLTRRHPARDRRPRRRRRSAAPTGAQARGRHP